MAEIQPKLTLQCALCEERMPDNATIEAYQLHMQVEHDTDEVRLDLRAVCTCGAAMTFTESHKRRKGFEDRFHCHPCGNTGGVHRKADPPDSDGSGADRGKNGG